MNQREPPNKVLKIEEYSDFESDEPRRFGGNRIGRNEKEKRFEKRHKGQDERQRKIGLGMKFNGKSLLVAFLCLGHSSIASSGDRAESFQKCLKGCQAALCESKKLGKQPLALRITRWSCVDECKYQCIHKSTDFAVAEIQRGYTTARVEQYYGKWPFWRFMGMQEPASVLFSLLNLWAHVNGGRHLLRRIKKDHPMYTFYLFYVIIGVNAWVWSAVFHTRDKPITEKLDYFSAGLTILYSLYIAVIRLFRLYRPPKLYLQQSATSRSTPHWLPPRHIQLQLWSVLCALLYIVHIIYLSVIPRFDYTYNVIVNLIIGTLHNLLWASYSLRSTPLRRFDYQPRTYMPPYAWKPAAMAVAATLVILLEIFDFPPWGRVIDAHSLWHLSTAPLVWAWYRFLAEDATDPGWMAGRLPPASKAMVD